MCRVGLGDALDVSRLGEIDPMLEQAEVGSSGGVSYYDLTVQDRRLDLDLGEVVDNVEIGLGVVTCPFD